MIGFGVGLFFWLAIRYWVIFLVELRLGFVRVIGFGFDVGLKLGCFFGWGETRVC